MVHRRDLHQRADAAAGALLGFSSRQIPRRHEDADGDGLSLCQDKCHLLEQEASRGESSLIFTKCTCQRVQMLAFIQSQPDVVERILHHIENPSFVDLLVRIIQLDEYQGGAGVLEVCI